MSNSKLAEGMMEIRVIVTDDLVDRIDALSVPLYGPRGRSKWLTAAIVAALERAETFIAGAQRAEVPLDFPVKVIAADDHTAIDPVTCGQCGRTWDDAVATSMTPAPGARCPFEHFHS